MIPKAVRHLIVAPLFVAFVAVAVALTPLLVVVTGLWSLVLRDRRWRPVRALLFTLAYGVHDVAAVMVGLGLWLRLGGRGAMAGEAMQTRHYALATWLLGRASTAADRLLALRVEVKGDADAVDAVEALDQPLIVLSRHAGPGDSFLIVRELLSHGRRPRIVLRAALQLDPGLDILGNRLPFCWVTRRGGDSEAICLRIAEITAGMDGRGALLLFPEGGNVTPARRRGSIRHLLRAGARRLARRAADLDHLTAPRPAGTLAALRAGGTADVIFVAHSGLAGMQASLWRRVPVDRVLRLQLFLVRAGDIPREEDARVEWLFDWWARLDAWVDYDAIAHTTSPRPVPAPVRGDADRLEPTR
ncbi:MAG: 1-acyl-sn-glycerol-3-phosphate acyltransferase [Candidatus Dormibacteria bacterium]